MHGAGITLIVGVILVGCAPEASSPTVATIAATPTEQPAATKVAWPAEWGDDVCAVLATFSLAAQDAADMQAAAELGDAEDVSLQAYGILGQMQGAAALIARLPTWTPGDDATAALGDAIEAYGSAAALIDDGIQSGDFAMVEQGWTQMADADILAGRAVDALDALEADTGFRCN